DELRPVVATDVPGHATRRCQLDQHIDHIPGCHRPPDLQRQAFPRVLIDDAQPLETPTIGGAVKDEVPRPHVILVLGTLPHDAVATVADSTLFHPFLRNFQALTLPQPPHTLAVDLPSFASEHRPDHPIPAPRIPAHQLVHPPDQLPFIISTLRLVALRPPGLSQHPARPTLAHLQLLLNMSDRRAATRRGQPFPR